MDYSALGLIDFLFTILRTRGEKSVRLETIRLLGKHQTNHPPLRLSASAGELAPPHPFRDLRAFCG
jgi:hypothetical protein